MLSLQVRTRLYAKDANAQEEELCKRRPKNPIIIERTCEHRPPEETRTTRAPSRPTSTRRRGRRSGRSRTSCGCARWRIIASPSRIAACRASREGSRNTRTPYSRRSSRRKSKTKRKGPSSPRPRRITIPIVPIAPISIPTSLVWVQDLRSYSWTLPPRGGPHKFPLTLDGAPVSTRDAAPTPSTLRSKRAGRCVKTASCLYLQVSPYLP